MLEKYEQFALTQLGIPAAVRPGSGELVQGLFLPSFDPELCISLVFPGEGDGVLSIGAFASNCWYERSSGKRAPRVLRASATLPEDTWLMLQLELDALPREELVDVPVSGTDGISMLGKRCSAERDTLLFRAWSPGENSAAHRFFSLLVLAAQEVIFEEQVLPAMERLHGYINVGLPVRDLGGSPRRIRVFGYLTHRDQISLERTLSALPQDGEIFVDMSHLQDIHASLLPLFQQFNQRPGKTIFVTSQRARQLLQRAGAFKMIWPGEFRRR